MWILAGSVTSLVTMSEDRDIIIVTGNFTCGNTISTRRWCMLTPLALLRCWLWLASCWGEPNHIARVLVGFSRSWLAFSKASMSTRNAVRHPMAASASLADVLSADVSLHIINEGQLCGEGTTAGPVRIFAETAPAAQQIVDHCRQSAALCRSAGVAGCWV